jgi:hypothetical protein
MYLIYKRSYSIRFLIELWHLHITEYLIGTYCMISVLHQLRFEEFYVEWCGPNEIYMYSESRPSRFARAVGSKLGLQKGKM